VLELDEHAQVISYEQYYPYGATSYQAVRARTDTPKRYRFTGKERDTETGLYYHGARYYIAWLGRWSSCDPAGLADGPNLYAYVRGNPIRLSDSEGTAAGDTVKGLLSRAEGWISKVKVKVLADAGDFGSYARQGAARYVDQLERAGGRLTEAEHPLAGAALKILNKDFKYRTAKSIVIDRSVALKKTVGDLRLIKMAKQGAIGAEQFAARSAANFVKAIGMRWAQTGEVSTAALRRELRQAVSATEEATKEALPALANKVDQAAAAVIRNIRRVRVDVPVEAPKIRVSEKALQESSEAAAHAEAIVLEHAEAETAAHLAEKSVGKYVAKAVPGLGIGVGVALVAGDLKRNERGRAVVDAAEAIPAVGGWVLVGDLANTFLVQPAYQEIKGFMDFAEHGQYNRRWGP
jgi:RHS repeat-associated protein